MISMLLLAMSLMQGPRALQPGTGIVMGTIQLEGAASAAGVRVAAIALDDPSSLVSVTETDAAGHYRLTNIPAGKYFIGAGRLDNLVYYPGGTDRAKATEVTVEAAKITTIGSFTVPAQSKRAIAPSISSSPQSDQESIAYRQIAAERNAESKKKLMLNFEKTYPNSSRLAEIYMELSRTLASQTDFGKANEYAEKAVARVAKLKME
jgi:hypothetical protein